MTQTLRSRWAPRAVGVAVGAVALLVYAAALLLFPSVLDWAFDEGGKAPMLVAVIGATLTLGAYWGGESLAAKLLRR